MQRSMYMYLQFVNAFYNICPAAMFLGDMPARPPPPKQLLAYIIIITI